MPGATRSIKPPALLLVALFLSLPAPPVDGAPRSRDDELFRSAYARVESEEYSAAREALRQIDPKEFDLGDYVVYLVGLSHAREGDRPAAARTLEALSGAFPASPLAPHLSLELAFLAAKDNDVAAARTYLGPARGKASGNGRRAEERFVAARLLEEDGPLAAAAEAHLANFAAAPASEGGTLSMERLWGWRAQGTLAGLKLPLSFHATFANALGRASEHERAEAVYGEAIEAKTRSDDYYSLLLDYAEFLRKRGETGRSRKILARALADAPPSFRLEVEFLRARVDWKAGRLTDARKTFLAIAENGSRPATAERARYLAAWIAEEDGDLEALTSEFGKLRGARDSQVRAEATFRHAFGLFRQARYAEAAAAFAEGEKSDFSPVERARNSFWKAKALIGGGEAAKGEALLASVAADPGAGPYALFAAREAGKDPYAMLNAPPGGETASCGEEKAKLWEKIRSGKWSSENASRVRRAERLVELGIVEYAVLEAQGVDPAAARAAIGLTEGGAAALFRYLAGDLRGAIRETGSLSNDPAAVELIDRIQYPLAPQYVGDCESRVSDIDPLVLHALIRQESSFHPAAVSAAGAVGLMQLLPRTAAETARREKLRKPRRKDLVKPELNVRLGAAYLARLLRSQGGDYLRAVAAYNAGEDAVSRWWEAAGGDPAAFLERITYRETRFYVRRVFLNLLQYYLIYRPLTFARYFPSVPAGAPQAPGGASTPPSGATGAATAPSGGTASPAGGPSASPPPPPPSGIPGPPAPPAPGPR